MLDWLIVGGGIHGTHLSLILRQAGVGPGGLRVLDPWEEPLARWTLVTRRTGMDFLRSPGVHHVGEDPYDLFRFAGRRRARAEGFFRGRYRRPALELFQAHARTRIGEEALEDLRLRGWARGVRGIPGGYRVETDRGGVEARRVVLSLGAPDPAPAPPWAHRLREGGVPVLHLFAEGTRVDHLFHALRGSGAPVAVLGGGISAAQVTLRLAREGSRPVLLTRHPVRVHPFDSAPGWLGPKYLREFHRERSPRVRRERIQVARNRGSLPDEVAGALRKAAEEGEVGVCVGEVLSVDVLPEGRARLHLSSAAPDCLDVEGVILATGWAPGPPGGAWLRETAGELGLPIAPCGFPIPDPGLRWGPGLYLTGALAELEVGPASRNIAGARMAAARIREAAGG